MSVALRLAVFSVRKFKQAILAGTLKAFKMDVNCSQTRKRDITFIITLRGPDTTSISRFNISKSSDSVSSAREQAGVRITAIMRMKIALLDQILINNL